MKIRSGRSEDTEGEERDLAASLRGLAEAEGDSAQPAASSPYWQNLIVRTNEQIDAATSTRALSISWAARVAIPGVVAIISFFVGLHYYVPQEPNLHSTITRLILELPAQTVDSLLTEPSQVSESMSIVDLNPDVFSAPADQIAEYLIENGGASSLVESIPDKQAEELLVALSTTAGENHERR